MVAVGLIFDIGLSKRRGFILVPLKNGSTARIDNNKIPHHCTASKNISTHYNFVSIRHLFHIKFSIQLNGVTQLQSKSF